MKRPFTSCAMGVVALVLLLATSALAALDPPHNYACSYCHNTYGTYGVTTVNNVCLQCHNPSNPAVSNRAFVASDMANPFGSTAMQVFSSNVIRTQSSHNWSSSDTNPAAGASTPISSVLNVTSDGYMGQVSCNRCHGVHLLSSTLPPSQQPYLRLPVDQDQLCLDCHRSRNHSDASYGSHPVNMTYTSATRGKSSEYNALPLTNATNPTADLQLKSGKVLCMTCHNVHYADSNGSTFDNASSAVQGKLSSSQGFLLRTNMRGSTTADTNICTNCHNKPNHSSLSNIQCTDCHAGHVDYDPLGDPNGLKNVYLIRRYVNYSSGIKLSTYRRRVLFQYTSSTQKNYNKNSTGICLACHGTLPSTVSEHSSTDASVCNTCHTHGGTGQGGFIPSCTSCHGYPPSVNTAGGPSGYANDAAKGYNYSTFAGYKDESLTPHASHAGGGATGYSFDCSQCHQGNTHDSGTFQDVFKSPASPTATIASLNGATPTYTTTGSGTCNNVYCHSNGAPSGGTIAWKSQPTWANGKGTIIGAAGECNSCHDATPATNAHTAHAVTMGYGCVTCHSATVSNNTTLLAAAKAAGGTHVNGVKDILFSGTVGANTLSGSSCSNIYCHSNGKGVYSTPVWTNPSTGACGTCHATTPVIGGATLISTNGHFAHFSSASNSYGPMLTQQNTTSCSTCHTFTGINGATHVNGTIDAPTTNCTACHKQGAPVWTAGPVACESCHTTTGGALSVINGITAPDKTSFAGFGHGQYSSSTVGRIGCLSCHVRNDRHITKALGSTTRLGSTYAGTNQNNLCGVCHNDATKVTDPNMQNMSAHVVDKNTPTPTSGLCSACHDVHGVAKSGQLFMIYTSIFAPTNPDTAGNGVAKKISFANTSTAFINSTRTGLCQVCHTKTNHYRNYTSASYTAYNGSSYNSIHPTRNCLACHDHKGAFAFKPNGSCDSCHGYPPVASTVGLDVHNNYTSARNEVYNGGGYINGGGAHSVPAHIALTAKATDAWNNCAICHSGGSLNPSTHLMQVPVQQKNVVINVDPRYKFDSSKPITYTGPLNGTGTGAQTTGQCTNVSCHFQKSPVWAP